MNMLKVIGILLIVAGAFGLAYGGFTYTQETHEANIGPLHVGVDEKKHVNIPVWAGVAGVLLGGVLLFSNRKSLK